MLKLPNKFKPLWPKFYKQNEVLIYKYVLRCIKKNLMTKKLMPIVSFEDGTHQLIINGNELSVPLEYALNLFIRHEEYEYANKAQALLNEYHINKLIQETSLSES